MSRSAPSSISRIEPRVLHDLQAQSDKISQPPGSPAQSDDGSQVITPTLPSPRLNRAVSWGGPWGVVTFGRGFNWKQGGNYPSSLESDSHTSNTDTDLQTPVDNLNDLEDPNWGLPPHVRRKLELNTSVMEPVSAVEGLSVSPDLDPAPRTPVELNTPTRPALGRSITSQSMRRRSSGKRFSLVAGRISYSADEPVPTPPPEPKSPIKTPRLLRFGSSSSFLSVQSAVAPTEMFPDSFLGGRSIDEFEIEEEIGRGAYGLVKRAREITEDGSLGPPIILKQVIKSRILADCWKKHPKYGTIPIEIYVMSAISAATYTLPAPRPWDPARHGGSTDWIEGSTVHGHPNVCPLVDFFEDLNYYYLILPYTIPSPTTEEDRLDKPPAKDLFDLVEEYPQGLPPAMVRTYLGQIADAMSFLHLKGIVHRDLKDENVVLGPQPGKCILIDFGSSGVVRKNGWDTFSGTLDYAGPEILRGERYSGKEQDVWAFGVVAYVLLVGECPFVTSAEAQEGLVSPLSTASIALDERCGGEHEMEGEEGDGGGTLCDAAELVRQCLQVEVEARPTFERILESRFLSGRGGWGAQR